jgi:flagellar motility protein MotE (MotC chaperone)
MTQIGKRLQENFIKMLETYLIYPLQRHLYVRIKTATSQKKKQILERWQQYLKELLQPETERINSIKTQEGPINNLQLEEITYEEINEIIKNMKPNKAAGPDKILPEFIKNGKYIN